MGKFFQVHLYKAGAPCGHNAPEKLWGRLPWVTACIYPFLCHPLSLRKCWQGNRETWGKQIFFKYIFEGWNSSSKRKTRCGEEVVIWFSEKFSATDVISFEGEVLIWFFIELIWFIGNFSANEVISIVEEVLIWFFYLIDLIFYWIDLIYWELFCNWRYWMQTPCSYLSEAYLWQFKWNIFWIRTSHKKYGKW